VPVLPVPGAFIARADLLLERARGHLDLDQLEKFFMEELRE
jgi:hypothetical protein